ncbi:MAG: response regulator [Verrucomicrobiota bacterium]|jgi:CheY-like chemotaxis protein/DNA-binding XRE family transcriptional regulator
MATPEIILQFGAAVRRLRYGLDISQATLAKRAGLHQTYIAGIESGGRNVTLKSIDRLAAALQVSTANLLLAAGAPAGPLTGSYVDILMVEDNPDDVAMTLHAFKQARITNPVRVVRDGKEALDFLFPAENSAGRNLQTHPHLVLLDLHLPKISGIEVLHRIKSDERTRSIPVVILTGSQDSQILAECRRLGAKSCITKPVDFQRLGQATLPLNLNWALLKPPDTMARGAHRSSLHEH